MPTDYAELMTLKKVFSAVLTREHDKRPRDNWIDLELSALLKAINVELKNRGREEITKDELKSIEITALGHVDYASKFALYCAEFVCNRKPV